MNQKQNKTKRTGDKILFVWPGQTNMRMKIHSLRDPFPRSPGIVVAACPCVARGIDWHPRVATITNVAKRCKGNSGKRQCGAVLQPHARWTSRVDIPFVPWTKFNEENLRCYPVFLSPYFFSALSKRNLPYISQKNSGRLNFISESFISSFTYRYRWRENIF